MEAESQLSTSAAGTASAASSAEAGGAAPATPWQDRALRNLQVPDASLLRGMPVASGLRGFSGVLSALPPTAEYFKLSEPVDCIDVFVSHNWNSPRWKKFLVLAFHFNLHGAFVIGILVGAVSCCLTYQGILPVAAASNAWLEDGKEQSHGFLALPLGVGAFLVSFFTLHELDRLPFPPFKRRMLWLDRTCVHQTQPDKKKAGIQCLAAFLARSQDILICFSDIYMNRLWTLYEVATWLMLHRGRRVLLRPLLVPCVLLVWLLGFAACVGVVYLVQFTRRKSSNSAQPLLGPALQSLCIFLFNLSGNCLGARLARDRECIVGQVRSFRLADAVCAKEEDRRVIQRNILAFMKHANLCDADEDDAKVFEAFEQLVQKDVPKLLVSAFGRVGMPYSWVIATFLFPVLLLAFDRVTGMIIDSRPPRYIALQIAFWAALVLCIIPLVHAMAMASARDPRCRRLPLLAALAGVSTLFLVGFTNISFTILVWALEDDLWLALLLLVYAFLALPTYLVYRPLPPFSESPTSTASWLN